MTDSPARAWILAILGLMLAVPAYSRVSLRLNAGLTGFSGSNWNTLARSQNGLSGFYPADPDPESGSNGVAWTVDNRLPLLGTAPGVEAEVVLELNRRLAIGLQSGFFRISRRGYARAVSDTAGLTETSYRVSASQLPLSLSLHYRADLGRSSRLVVRAGPAWFFGRFAYRSEASSRSGSYLYWEDATSFTSRRGSLGLQGEIALERPLTRSVALYASLSSRLAGARALRGDWSSVGRSYLQGGGPWSRSLHDVGLWVFDGHGFGKAAQFMLFSPDSPNPLHYPGVEPCRFDWSGVSAALGLRWTW